MQPLRLVFMGTPAFAVPTLDALCASGHSIAAVYTQPPRAAERGRRVRPTPVAVRAEAAGIEVTTPASLKPADAQTAFAALGADLAVTVAYGLILPPAVLAAPRMGCINAHASLLPRWRGAAPIQRAIMAGDGETGVTIMRMDEGLDTGPILMAERVPIGPGTTGGALHDTLAALSARLVVEAIDALAGGTLTETPQPGEGATYAAKLEKHEAAIDWRAPAAHIERRVRALAPGPGAWLDHEGDRIKVLAAERVAGATDAPPGTIIDAALAVACGDGAALRPTRLQRAGKAVMDRDAFLRGRPIAAGTRLPCPATS
ncbi:MAG: methionyl-tRNA formyltransferase [Rhodospirillaceae bacterium]|nr:methionyl-tRNA formyltransferase [Rhodospirillaceae bacterium]